MPGQGRVKNCFKSKFNHLLNSLVPCRSRSPSTNPPITPALDHQASSTNSPPVGPDPTSIHRVPDEQPLNSPSLSNVYPSIVIQSSGDEAPGRMTDLVSVGFEGVKTTLRLVERVASAFPPLKLAVSGLLGVIDIVEVCDFDSALRWWWCWLFSDNRSEPTRSPRSGAEAESRRLSYQ